MNYVLGFIVCKETRQVLLIEKIKPEFQKGHYNGVGGKIEGEELAKDAMQREAKEETGLDIKNWIRYAKMYCTKNSIDNISDSWSVKVFIADVSSSVFDSFEELEQERLVVVHLSNIHVLNHKLLGNITWLLGMGLDFLMNGEPFKPVDIEYTGLSKAFVI